MGNLDIARAAIFTPADESSTGEVTWGLPICFWGDPGIGKTWQVSGMADTWAMYLEVLSPGERGEGAFGVTPVPHGKVLTYPAPDWVVNLEEGGILFLDEVNQAPPPLQPALMGVLLARRIGGAKLNGRVRPIAAANPTEKSAGGWDFAPPVANRMGHLDWDDPSPGGWSDWLLDGAAHAKPGAMSASSEEERVLRSWADPWARTRGLFAGFVKARGELLHKMPEMGKPELHRAWPSPRTWAMAARAHTSAQVNGLSAEDTESFVSAFVGKGAAGELFAYAAKMDLPNPADVLDGRVQFKFEPKRLDRAAAVLGACQALVTPEGAERRKERAVKLWQILGEKALVEGHMDVVFGPAKALVQSKLHAHKEAYPTLQKMLPLLKAAGIQYDPNSKSE